jgi:hypothetical protein
MALALSACGPPPGIDGNLVNNWASMPDAVIPVPSAAVCYDVATDDPTSVTKWPAPVDCGLAHTVETAHVGTIEGDDAQAASAPASGSAGRRSAYEKCAAEAKTYLGDDWRTGRLDLVVVFPITLHWQAGARYYRCDLIEYKDLDEYGVVSRTASLKGALTGERSVGLSCMNVTQTAAGRIDKMLPIACGTAHNGEFAGIFDQPDGAYPTDAAAASKARLDGCAKVVAAFAGVPNDRDLQARIGWIALPFSQIEWGLGNRGVRCYANSSDKLTGSIKGAGPGKLPID